MNTKQREYRLSEDQMDPNNRYRVHLMIANREFVATFRSAEGRNQYLMLAGLRTA